MTLVLSLAAFIAFIFALPAILRKVKTARPAATGAVALALGMAFSAFLDPAKKVSIERIEKAKETGAKSADAGDTRIRSDG
ncbi:hypothetical protein [Sphingomonas sp. RS2018]